MFFTSYEFIGFIALVFLLYYLVPKKFQWALLLIASYIFYFIAGPSFLIYILVTTITIYLTGRLIQANADATENYIKQHKAELTKEDKKTYKKKQKSCRFRWLILCLLLNLGILAVVKYTNFFISNWNGIASNFGSQFELSFVSIAFPMGISFYTFQALGYLIDVYRGTIQAEKNPFKLALFISFFPQLIQGPISRFSDLAETMFAQHPFESKRFFYGLQRMLWGYFKKMVIADRILTAVLEITSDCNTYPGAFAFVGMIFYTIELYADFTGGIDITIGIAEALGITVQENFIRPYFSKSLKEYWRRWHITMGTWFKDYLFYPISICGPMQKFSKFCRKHLGNAVGKRLPVYVACFTVWFATGIWHGASWNFIVWGLMNCVILLVSEEFEPLYDKFHKKFKFSNTWGYRLFQVGRTFILISCLKMFDCYASVADTFHAFGSMFTATNWQIIWDGSLLQFGLTWIDYVIFIAGTLLMLGVSLVQRSGSVRDKIASRPYPFRFAIWFGLFLLVLLMGAYGIGYDASQFIYNRF